MKRIISLGSWLLLLAASGIGIAILIGQPPLPNSDPNLSKSLQESDEKLSSSFPIDQPRSIDFDIDDSSGSQLGPRELVDQKRDWLLFTIASASGAPSSTVNRSLFDLAPIRHGYLDQLCRFEYGETRSFCLDASRVVAVVPKSAEQSRLNDLARVFDEARKNLGKAPETIEVFEYTIEGSSKATITRRASIPGSVFLGAASGYKEVSVSTAPELKAFMTDVDDVVFAKIEDSKLRLGGRKLADADSQNIELEEVAALWQSEQAIQMRRQEFDERWRRRAERLNAEWNQKVYFSRHEYDLAFEALQRENDKEMEAANLVRGSGFSLDPTYDYSGLAATLSKPSLSEILKATQWSPDNQFFYMLEASQRIRHVSELRGASEVPMPRGKPVVAGDITLAALMREAKFPDSALAEVINALCGQANESSENPPKVRETSKPDVVPFLRVLDRVKSEEFNQNDAAKLLAVLFQELDARFHLQKARYDGPLQGTKAGMVLFYTDLLAKLWAIDYLDSTPSEAIRDFEPLTRTVLSNAYRAEETSLPNIRLWFGPEDSGYQILSGNAIEFARNATRIYAASSNPLEPGKETEPTASANAFLGWWNDHYEEVARYEPQYRRLNEIMKWSLIISWLNQSSSDHLLSFLAEVPVSKSAWFADWARNETSLRFRNWNKVTFYPRGYLGIQTEAMPMLFSRQFCQFADENPLNPPWTLEGGVSLASRDLLKERVALSESVPQVLRRSNLEYGKSASEPLDELVTTRGVRYHFEDHVFAGVTEQEVSTTKIIPKDGLKFRSRYGDLKDGQMEWTVTRSGAGIQVEARTGSSQIGHLQVMPSRNGFSVGWHAREVDDGFTIARRVSSAPDIGAALRSDPLVEYALNDGTGVFYVKSAAARKWMKIAPEGQNAPGISAGWEGRVADLTAEAKPVNVAWIDEGRIPREAVDNGNWVRGPPPRVPGASPPAEEMDDFFAGQLTWRDAAREILKNPVELKRLADSHFVDDLREIDLLLANRQTEKALSLIKDRLIRFGDHEQLRLREALAELARGRADASVEALNDLHLENRYQGDALINEINARLKVAEEPDERLYQIADAIDWQTSPMKPAGDKVLFVTDKDGKLSIDLDLGSAPAGSRISPDNIPNEAIVYCENAPGLNKVDWSVGVRRALDQIAEQQLGDAIELPRADIAHFNPAYIHLNNTQFSSVGQNTKFASAHQTHLSIPNVYSVWNGGGNNDDDKKHRQGIGSMHSEQAARVFLLMAPATTSSEKPSEG